MEKNSTIITPDHPEFKRLAAQCVRSPKHGTTVNYHIAMMELYIESARSEFMYIKNTKEYSTQKKINSSFLNILRELGWIIMYKQSGVGTRVKWIDKRVPTIEMAKEVSLVGNISIRYSKEVREKNIHEQTKKEIPQAKPQPLPFAEQTHGKKTDDPKETPAGPDEDFNMVLSARIIRHLFKMLTENNTIEKINDLHASLFDTPHVHTEVKS